MSLDGRYTKKGMFHIPKILHQIYYNLKKIIQIFIKALLCYITCLTIMHYFVLHSTE